MVALTMIRLSARITARGIARVKMIQAQIVQIIDGSGRLVDILCSGIGTRAGDTRGEVGQDVAIHARSRGADAVQIILTAAGFGALATLARDVVVVEAAEARSLARGQPVHQLTPRSWFGREGCGSEAESSKGESGTHDEV